jgi:hypothetical protein
LSQEKSAQGLAVGAEGVANVKRVYYKFKMRGGISRDRKKRRDRKIAL